MKPLTALIILDGFGCRKDEEYNAIFTDGAKNISALKAAYPYTELQASGLDVGLPAGQMGNRLPCGAYGTFRSHAVPPAEKQAN